MEAVTSSIMGNRALPAERENLPHSVTQAEHGKPVSLPLWVGMPQGRLMVMRVRDVGTSECRAVMARIRVATSPDAKAGRLPSGLPSRESLTNRLKKQGR